VKQVVISKYAVLRPYKTSLGSLAFIHLDMACGQEILANRFWST
jgi:hypothetical protein